MFFVLGTAVVCLGSYLARRVTLSGKRYHTKTLPPKLIPFPVIPQNNLHLRGLLSVLTQFIPSLSSASKWNVKKSKLHFQHHCDIHLKKEVSQVRDLTLETLAEAWAGAAEASAQSAPLTHKFS